MFLLYKKKKRLDAIVRHCRVELNHLNVICSVRIARNDLSMMWDHFLFSSTDQLSSCITCDSVEEFICFLMTLLPLGFTHKKKSFSWFYHFADLCIDHVIADIYKHHPSLYLQTHAWWNISACPPCVASYKFSHRVFFLYLCPISQLVHYLRNTQVQTFIQSGDDWCPALFDQTEKMLNPRNESCKVLYCNLL